MKSAFTLVELLVVVGIMGLLGTASVGGYRQMRRGMEEKGVIRDVNTFIRAAYQRAQIDRQPTAVMFWNETLRAERDSGDGNLIVVGHAVAVRRAGRATAVDGDYIVDEFADLELSNPTDFEEDGSAKPTMYIYPMNNLGEIESGSTIRRTMVETKVYDYHEDPNYISLPEGASGKSETVNPPADDSDDNPRKALADGESTGRIHAFSYKIVDLGGVTWRPGMAYGFEFASLTLPHGYIFGSSYSSSSSNPISEAGTLVFDVGVNKGSGTSGGVAGRTSVTISALLPGATGALEAKQIGKTENPTLRLK